MPQGVFIRLQVMRCRSAFLQVQPIQPITQYRLYLYCKLTYAAYLDSVAYIEIGRRPALLIDSTHRQPRLFMPQTEA